jgi:cytochrome c
LVQHDGTGMRGRSQSSPVVDTRKVALGFRQDALKGVSEMKLKIATIVAAATLATAGFAESHPGSGDVPAGEKYFGKCKACHMIQNADGEAIVKGGKTGPNLYGIVGRQAGTVEGFRYGDALVAAGEAGLVWDEASFVGYGQNPKGFLSDTLGGSAKSKMSFRLKKGMEDVYAYLASVGPAPAE